MDTNIILGIIAFVFGILILWNRATTGILVGIYLLLVGVLSVFGAHLGLHH